MTSRAAENAARELGEHVAVSAPEPAALLSHEEFAASVKEALRSMDDNQSFFA
jgi:hypothetical protein